jgi:hypothetical protein
MTPQRWRLALLLLACGLQGCPRRIPERGAGREEEEVTECGARLEELTAIAEHGNAGFFGPCPLASEGCELERRICTITGRTPDREDLRRRCAIARDNCQRLNLVCANGQQR